MKHVAPLRSTPSRLTKALTAPCGASHPSPTVRGMPFTQSLPRALSPSRLEDFQRCPRRYQYASIERRRQPATYATVKGRVVHHVLESLFAVDAEARTTDVAWSALPGALDTVLSEEVRADLALDDELARRLRDDAARVITSYFTMEDPGAVHVEGVELRLHATVNGAPLLGILDRLDRDEHGELVIVDYKTGSIPSRAFDTATFANTELYAALCESTLGERPTRIRLLYVTHGEAMERAVSAVVLDARVRAASSAWTRITRYYESGEFPATPSRSACRFCPYTDVCRESGVAVVTG